MTKEQLELEILIKRIVDIAVSSDDIRMPVELLVNILLEITKQKNIDAYNLLTTIITIYGNKVLNFKEKDAQLNKLLNILEK